MLTCQKLPLRFNIEYTILFFEEKMPEKFTVRELEVCHKYLSTGARTAGSSCRASCATCARTERRCCR